jgi:hypothetical protein
LFERRLDPFVSTKSGVLRSGVTICPGIPDLDFVRDSLPISVIKRLDAGDELVVTRLNA